MCQVQVAVETPQGTTLTRIGIVHEESEPSTGGCRGLGTLNRQYSSRSRVPIGFGLLAEPGGATRKRYATEAEG
jgi:hypothetical protein